MHPGHGGAEQVTSFKWSGMNQQQGTHHSSDLGGLMVREAGPQSSNNRCMSLLSFVARECGLATFKAT